MLGEDNIYCLHTIPLHAHDWEGICSLGHTKTVILRAIHVVVQWIETLELVNSFVIFVFDEGLLMLLISFDTNYIRLHWEESTRVAAFPPPSA